MTTVIKVENLGKKYLIGHEKQARYRYSTLRDSIGHGVKSAARRLMHPLQANTEDTELEEFWALKDLNFEIQQGDKVGIIDRNGAGFHPMLTGRENLYVNGAILGMSNMAKINIS